MYPNQLPAFSAGRQEPPQSRSSTGQALTDDLTPPAQQFSARCSGTRCCHRSSGRTVAGTAIVGVSLAPATMTATVSIVPCTSSQQVLQALTSHSWPESNRQVIPILSPTPTLPPPLASTLTLP